MDSKLYPPYVEGTLPAFVQGGMLVVPFQLNRAVARTDFNSMAIILKTVQTNTILCDGDPQYAATNIEYDNTTGHWKAIFPIGNLVRVGQYYKVQVAFANGHYSTPGNWAFDGQIGYYSDVSVVKCTSQPSIIIKNLSDTSSSNTHRYEYTGVYSQAGEGKDKTEKVYSYRFDLRNEANEIIATSGDQIHNASLDTEKFESTDTWLVTKDLKPGYWYSIQYTVTTLNNLTTASPAYKVMQMETVDCEIGAHLLAEMMHEDGYVNISLKPKAQGAKSVRGSFVLIRSSSEDNYDSWQELYRFDMINEKPDMTLWQDFTVQQGVSYKYALQAYNDNGLYSNRLLNKEGAIFADFEDAFLFDGEKQLSIRFNPKVSSFKTTMLESKMDTLGGKHPFIFRNGNVAYKEFPISGMISMLSDPNELFMKGIKSAGREVQRGRTAAYDDAWVLDTQLTGENFRKEREFKMAVLDWLNDGKPKLFRSPGEGNYIVRLMNSSLSPNDTLGRMLHTFSSTAYEIAECNFQNLNHYGFVKSPHIHTREMTIDQRRLQDIFSIQPTPGQAYDLPGAAYFMSITNQYQDELIFDFYFLDGTIANWDVHNVTGQFNVPVLNSPIVKMVYRSGRIREDALVTFGYYRQEIDNDFSFVTKMTIEDKIEQRIGGDINKNIIEELEDVRLQTGRFYYIKITPRYIFDVYVNGSNYYFDKDYENIVSIWDETALYHVKNASYWLDGSPIKRMNTTPIFAAQLNSTSYTDLQQTEWEEGLRTAGRFEAIMNVDDVQILKIGSGVMIDMVYQLKTLEYALESTDSNVIQAKNAWLLAIDNYKAAEAAGSSPTTLKTLQDIIDVRYGAYITKLDEALKQAQEDIIYAI